MAAPRGMRAFLLPVRRAKVATRCQFYPHTALRAKSNRADEDRDADQAEFQKRKAKREDDSGEKSELDRQLLAMDIPPEEYKRLWKSKQVAMEKIEEWEPKTREQAQQMWKKMQTVPDHLTLLHMYKRAGVDPIELAKERGISLPTKESELDPESQAALEQLRDPINVRAIHLRPLRRAPQYGVPVADLQLRSYSIRNLLLFADFAVRAAYYMGLPAKGPVPLPRITERWTVPRSNFIFKKSQENFERITMRRLIQIQDGHPDVVKAWMAFLAKHQYHGVGMKANIWEYESLEAATRAGQEIKEGDFSRRRDGPMLKKIEEILGSEAFAEVKKGSGSEAEWRP